MPAGRHTVMDENTLHIFEEAYCNDLSDEQACYLAKIGESTLYKYQVEHPEFIERKRRLKDDTKLRARMKIREAILKEDKPDTARWYLERKDKEFKPKQEIEADVNIIKNIEDGIKKLGEDYDVSIPDKPDTELGEIII